MVGLWLVQGPRKADQHVNVTTNQVAHQLIPNGKVPNRQRQSKIKRCGQENHDFDDDFTITELQNSLKHLKNGKAAGLDKILTEEMKNFGPVTMQWVLSLLNVCARTLRLPRLWRQARVVALLKPGKDPSSPKSFRPISLLCHLYKPYERLILNRLSPVIEHVLIPEQAGFRSTDQHQLERGEPTATSRRILASHWTERCRIKHISRRPKRKSEQETTSSAN